MTPCPNTDPTGDLLQARIMRCIAVGLVTLVAIGFVWRFIEWLVK